MNNATRSPELFERHPANPILTADRWPYAANSVFNPGAVRLPSGQTLLLVRVEDARGISHLTAARSDDGVGDWQIDSELTLAPDPDRFPEEQWGIEDPRVTFLPELGRFAVTYTSYSRFGPCVSIALTEDFRSFERVGVALPPDNKDAALFPRRFDGRWAMLHRPYPTRGSVGAHIWLSSSPDLKHWGSHRVVIHAREGGWWDADKIGLAPPPIETRDGWLVLYHGVRQTAGGCLYRVGVALLDHADPTKLLARGDEWVFAPRATYEHVGDVAGVVFPCGATIDEAASEVRLYYGAADTSVGLATAGLNDLLDRVKNKGRSCP